MLNYGAELPLFPLNTVLFPGMMLPLHIFEERYKVMVRQCMAADHTFGVILAKSQRAQTPDVINIFPDDIFSIGTTAFITAVEQLNEGRMNLITVGQERFIIKTIRPSSYDYLIGEVDPLPLVDEASQTDIELMVKKLKPMVEQYIEYLADASGEDLSGAKLPNDLTALAYLAGTAVQGPLQDKQQLLQANSLNQLILKTVNVLDRENKILSYMLKAHHAHQQIERLPHTDYSLN